MVWRESEWLESCSLEVILLDLVMPVMKGEDVLAQLKADPSTENIPVVIVTSKHLQPRSLNPSMKKLWRFLSKTVFVPSGGPASAA